MVKTIAVDFDGTMNFYKEWKDGIIINKPIRGCIKALQYLHSLGYRIVIYTCRTNPNLNPNQVSHQLSMLRDWLNKNNLSFVAIDLEGKPAAEYYIDDRGITFKNNWVEIVSFIKKQSNNKKDKV